MNKRRRRIGFNRYEYYIGLDFPNNTAVSPLKMPATDAGETSGRRKISKPRTLSPKRRYEYGFVPLLHHHIILHSLALRS